MQNTCFKELYIHFPCLQLLYSDIDSAILWEWGYNQGGVQLMWLQCIKDQWVWFICKRQDLGSQFIPGALWPRSAMTHVSGYFVNFMGYRIMSRRTLGLVLGLFSETWSYNHFMPDRILTPNLQLCAKMFETNSLFPCLSYKKMFLPPLPLYIFKIVRVWKWNQDVEKVTKMEQSHYSAWDCRFDECIL